MNKGIFTHSAVMDIHNSVMGIHDMFHMYNNIMVSTIIWIP